MGNNQSRANLGRSEALSYGFYHTFYDRPNKGAPKILHQIPGNWERWLKWQNMGLSEWSWVEALTLEVLIPKCTQMYSYQREFWETHTQKRRHTKEDVTGSIPGLSRGLRIQRWPVGLGSSIAVSCGVGCRLVLDPALLCLWCRLAGSCSSDWNPSLGTSICCGCVP